MIPKNFQYSSVIVKINNLNFFKGKSLKTKVKPKTVAQRLQGTREFLVANQRDPRPHSRTSIFLRSILKRSILVNQSQAPKQRDTKRIIHHIRKASTQMLVVGNSSRYHLQGIGNLKNLVANLRIGSRKIHSNSTKIL